jgi:DNA-binding NarL/FixJ family response regulator
MELLPLADPPSPTGATLRALIVADDHLARGGLAALVATRESIVVAGQAAPHDDLAHAVVTYQPDVVIWDLGRADDDAIDLLAEAIPLLPLVVVLLAESSLAVRAWSAGARAVLHRDVTAGRLVAAAHAVAEGAVVLDEPFTDVLVRSAELPTTLREPLTPREMDVLRLLADGHANKGVALELGV